MTSKAETGLAETGLFLVKYGKYIYFLIGFLLVALAISLNVHASLGSDPLTSLANVISTISGLSIGVVLILLYVVFLIIHFIYFKKVRFVLIAFIFGLLTGVFIDLFIILVSYIPNDNYFLKVILLLSSLFLMGLGIALIQYSKFQKMAYEGFQEVIATIFKRDINFVRVLVEVSLLALAIGVSIISGVKFNEFVNVGTVVMMLCTGPTIYFIYKKILKGD